LVLPSQPLVQTAYLGWGAVEIMPKDSSRITSLTRATSSFVSRWASEGEPAETWCHRLSKATLIDPRTNHCIAYWDLVTSFALLFTALVTPVEVSFLQPPPLDQRWADPLFLTNRLVDVVFITDMLFQFRIAYPTEGLDGTRWIIDGFQVARHYGCSGWFALDLFSVSTSLFDVLGNEDTEDLKALRAVRCLRLIKLVKLARGSRIFKRWEMRLNINYAHLTLGNLIVGILVACHWFACIWGLQASFDPMSSWLSMKDYCVEWGVASQLEVEVMLVNGSCPEGWACMKGECVDGVCSGGYACAGALDLCAPRPATRGPANPANPADLANLADLANRVSRSPLARAMPPTPTPCADLTGPSTLDPLPRTQTLTLSISR
jgi:hypothetical protein